MSTTYYQVIVGNIGTVYDGTNKIAAMKCYREYVQQSKEGYGSAGHEPVTVFQDDEVRESYDPDQAFG